MTDHGRPTTEVRSYEERGGVPSEAGDIWLASGRGPAAGAQRRWGWPELANDNAYPRVTLPLRITPPENYGAAEEGPSELLAGMLLVGDSLYLSPPILSRQRAKLLIM
ncbi:MAG: hypothetical protein V3S55_04625 [Nitrospiraceae bacterium]